VSRGFDGPEMEDFRDCGWGQEGGNSNCDRSWGGGNDPQTRASVRLQLQKLRETESKSDQLTAHSLAHLDSSRPTLAADNRQFPLLTERDREKFIDRDKTYALRPSEIRTLAEVGKFRVVGIEDLAKLAYAGDYSRMQGDLRSLKEQKLVEQRGTSVLKRESRQILTLSKQGRRLIRRRGFVPENQVVYSGFVKPKEANHDADLYRLYQKVASEIEHKGGKVLRVQLDYELKEKLYQRLGCAQARGHAESQRLKKSFARDLQLPLVHSKVSFPDLRIEYATQEMEIARVDLELATSHYHAGHLAEKARAGFQIYARSEDAAGLRRIRDDHEIMISIMSL